MLSWTKVEQLNKVEQSGPTVIWAFLTDLTCEMVSVGLGVEQTFSYIIKVKIHLKNLPFFILKTFSIYINIYSTTFSLNSFKCFMKVKKSIKTVGRGVQLCSTFMLFVQLKNH